MRVLLASTVIIHAALSADVTLVSFDGTDEGAISKFIEMNDPVMGGQSTGTWEITNEYYGVMDGEVKDVPSLSAPGFIKASADGTFNDASAAASGGLVLKVRSSAPDYAGFRVSFASGTSSPSYACAGGGGIPFSRGCYKSPAFTVPAGDDFVDVTIPFSNFSDLWSSATGDQTKTCAEEEDVCPTAKKLAGIQRMEVWAEGADGKVHLEVQSISAVSDSAAAPGRSAKVAPKVAPELAPEDYKTCTGPVQDELKFNISSRATAVGLPVTVDTDESLAEAVCCDSRMTPYAEPMYTFTAPDIMMFSHLDEGLDEGVTTFYDSVCGLPLFRAPVNRTAEDFETDSMEHGWPSFRAAEVVNDNVVTDEETGYVTSACGTHLGSYLPDAEGARWCIDVSCVAGNPVATN